MAATKVFKEQLQVCSPSVQWGRRNKCEDTHVAVEAVVELPIQTTNFNLIYELTNGVYVSKSGKPTPLVIILLDNFSYLPNHELVFAVIRFTFWISRSEEIESDVGPDGVPIVIPIDGHRQDGDFRHEFLLRKL